jgi:hypothetical protein
MKFGLKINNSYAKTEDTWLIWASCSYKDLLSSKQIIQCLVREDRPNLVLNEHAKS